MGCDGRMNSSESNFGKVLVVQMAVTVDIHWHFAPFPTVVGQVLYRRDIEL